MANIVLKDDTGTNYTYNNVSKIKIPNADYNESAPESSSEYEEFIQPFGSYDLYVSNYIAE